MYKIFEIPTDSPLLETLGTKNVIGRVREEFAKLNLDLLNQLWKAADRWEAALDAVGLSEASSSTRTYVKQYKDIIKNAEKRCEAFTFLFVGLVGAGKTSTMLDLLGKSPDVINSYLRTLPTFQEGDEIRVNIGPVTKNFYDFLIQTVGIRLVDSPGIGGLMHEDKTIAPYVDLADCVLYIINSATYLTKSDLDFTRQYIAQISEANSTDKGAGRDTLMVVAWNRWVSENVGCTEEEKTALWEQILTWTFKGTQDVDSIASLFDKPPIPIRINSRRRSPSNGNVRPGEGETLYIDELLNIIKRVVEVEGPKSRISRPLNSADRMLQSLKADLTNVFLQHTPSGGKMYAPLRSDLEERLKGAKAEVRLHIDALCCELTPLYETAFFKAVSEWSPPSTFRDALRGLLPKAVFGQSLGREAATEAIVKSWVDSLRPLLRKHLQSSGAEVRANSSVSRLSEELSAAIVPDLALLPEGERVALEGRLRNDQYRASGTHTPEDGNTVAENLRNLIRQTMDVAIRDQIVLLVISVFAEIAIGAFTFGLTLVGSLVYRLIAAEKQDAKAKELLRAGIQGKMPQIMDSEKQALIEIVDRAVDKAKSQVESEVLLASVKQDAKHLAIQAVIYDCDAFQARIATYRLEAQKRSPEMYSA